MGNAINACGCSDEHSRRQKGEKRNAIKNSDYSMLPRKDPNVQINEYALKIEMQYADDSY